MTVLDEVQRRLTAYLVRPGPGRPLHTLGPLVELTGGWASSLCTFTARRAGPGGDRTATFVLKMYAPGAGGREHATREWLALTRLREAGHPVPRAVLVEPDARHLGRPFVVMDHIPGTSFWQALDAADPATRARLVRLFVAQLVALHARAPHLLDPSAGPAHPHHHLDRELAQLRRDSARSSRVALAGVVAWLEHRSRAVPCERPAILHRDYHPWNVLVDAGERLWVLDWDWRIGDARFDLAWTCTLVRRSGHHGFGDAVRDEYARQGDRSLEGLAYFEVLATARWLLNVLPPVGPDGSPAALREDFREFLVEPVRRAQELLGERTGVDVDVRL